MLIDILLEPALLVARLDFVPLYWFPDAILLLYKGWAGLWVLSTEMGHV